MAGKKAAIARPPAVPRPPPTPSSPATSTSSGHVATSSPLTTAVKSPPLQPPSPVSEASSGSLKRAASTECLALQLYTPPKEAAPKPSTKRACRPSSKAEMADTAQATQLQPQSEEEGEAAPAVPTSAKATAARAPDLSLSRPRQQTADQALRLPPPQQMQATLQSQLLPSACQKWAQRLPPGRHLPRMSRCCLERLVNERC